MKIKITTDSTCDIPKELAEKYDIDVLPLYVVKDDGTSYKDGVEITTPDVFEYTERTGKIVGTAAVTVGDYIERWSGYSKDFDAIIHIGFSSELSASHNNACIAAKEVGNVHVVDSLSLSTGMTNLAIDASIMAREGRTVEEIVKASEERVPKVDVSFVLNTLDYLRRGGRCTALQALGANVLGLKPCIEIREGKMSVAKKYRGKLENAFITYVKDRLEGRDDIDTHRIFITYSGITRECCDKLRETVLSCQPFEEIHDNLAGCTISGHCGPWCMGLAYYHK